MLNRTLCCVVLQIRLTTSTLTIAKISAMITDAVKSMQETAKAVLPDLETPDVPNLISQLPSELQSVTFSIDGSLSLVDDGSFTCASTCLLAPDCRSARRPAGVSVLQSGRYAMSNATIPLGLDLKLNTTGAQVFGFSWDLYLDVNFLPCGAASTCDLTAFTTNPLLALDDVSAGLTVQGNVTFPAPFGFATFSGSASTSHFAFSGASALNIAGYAIDLTVQMSSSSYSLAGSTAVAPFGTVSISGSLSTTSMSFAGSFDSFSIAGVTMSGTATLPATTLPVTSLNAVNLAVAASADLPAFGTASFSGEVSASGGLDMTASLSQTLVGVALSGTATAVSANNGYQLTVSGSGGVLAPREALFPACKDAQLNHTTLLLTRTLSALFATDVGEFGSLTFSGSIDTSGDFSMKGYVASSETASLSDTIVDALAEIGSAKFGTFSGWCTYKNRYSSSCRWVPIDTAKGFITGSNFALDNLETQFAASLQARAAPRLHKLCHLSSFCVLLYLSGLSFRDRPD